MDHIDNLLFPCLACLIIGALGGFVAGLKIAEAVLANLNEKIARLERKLATDEAEPQESAA